MPNPKKVEISRAAVPKEKQEETTEKYILKMYSKASAANAKINKKRRRDISLLLNILFVSAIVIFINFIILLFAKMFLG